MLWLQTNKQSSGTMNLGGSLTRQIEADNLVTDSSSHIVNIGRMVEVCYYTSFTYNFINLYPIHWHTSFRIWKIKFATL